LWLLFAVALAAGACSSGAGNSFHDSPAAPAGQKADDDAAIPPELTFAQATGAEIPDHCSSGHTFAYDLTEGQRNIPFPSDLFVVADSHTHTGRRVQLPDQLVTYLDGFFEVAPFIKYAINQLNGFGVTGAALFSTDAEPDGATLPDGGPPSASDSVFCAEIPSGAAAPVFAPLVFDWQGDHQLFKARPYLPLRQSTTYAVVVTDQVKPLQGGCYEAAPDFQYVRSAFPDRWNLRYDVLEPVRQQLAPMFDYLDQLGVRREHILSATFYSTQDITTDLFQMKDTLAQMAAQNPPQVTKITYTGKPNRLDSAWDLTYDTINWRVNGHIVYDENGRPQPQGTEQILAHLTLPSPTQYPKPWPVVVFMHGINADRNSVEVPASTLADYGFACIAIDDVFQGVRQNASNDVVVDLEFFNGFAPMEWRANWLQDLADQMYLISLVKTLGNLDLSPHSTNGNGHPDLDVSNIVFLGHSLGSIHGGIFAAVEDRISAFVFNSGASDYRAIALDCPVGSEIFQVLGDIQRLLNFGIASWADLLLDVLVIPVEAGDPEAYSPYVLHPLPEMNRGAPQIFQQMAAFDATLGADACGRMATTIGLSQLRPIVWQIPDLIDNDAPYGAPAVYQWNTDDHGMMWDYEDVRVQVANFFRTWVDTGTGIIAPAPPM